MHTRLRIICTRAYIRTIQVLVMGFIMQGLCDREKKQHRVAGQRRLQCGTIIIAAVPNAAFQGMHEALGGGKASVVGADEGARAWTGTGCGISMT